MAVIGTSYFPAIFPPVLRRETTLSSSKLNSNQIPKRYAAASSTDDASTSVKPTPRRSGTGRFGKKSGGEAENMQKRRGVDGDDDVDEGSSKEVNESEAIRKSLKNYFDEAAVMIRSDGGPPRWFSPLECGSRSPDSPLLIYLPGIDGIGIGLVMQHQALGKIFDIWCLHLPVQDRTSFTGLMNLIEKTVRSEHDRLPKRPIYIVGESIGACLALAVAARNSDIDLVQILANPATSFANSRLQAAIPSLQLMPDPTTLGISYILSLITGHQLDPLKMVINNAMKGFSLGSIIEDLAQTLASFTSYLPVMANILPKETLLWKLELLESASSYANARLREVKAQTLVLTSGNDPLLPSQEEGERLRRALPNCQTRKFNDHGHFLFLENDINLVTIIKGASFYRRGKYIDYVSDYIPITSSEFNKIHQYNRWWMAILSPVMLSTFADGKIVRGLSGIPSEGPVILVGYHMLLGLEVTSMMSQFMMERNILLRGITHPMLFQKPKEGGVVPDIDPSGVVNLVGAVPATGASLYKLLASKSHVLLYPGGAREALHRKGEEYKLFWPERSEFVRMAAKFGATIIPFGAVGEDDVAQIVLDYNDQMKIPFLRSLNEKATEETVKLRTDANGEVSNQQLHNPYFLPKVPGRFYYYFGKPIETKGRKEELEDKKKAQELYIQVKSEVERCIAYLKEKREKDPYRHLLPRLFFQTIHGFESEIPTFEL